MTELEKLVELSKSDFDLAFTILEGSEFTMEEFFDKLLKLDRINFIGRMYIGHEFYQGWSIYTGPLQHISYVTKPELIKILIEYFTKK